MKTSVVDQKVVNGGWQKVHWMKGSRWFRGWMVVLYLAILSSLGPSHAKAILGYLGVVWAI